MSGKNYEEWVRWLRNSADNPPPPPSPLDDRITLFREEGDPAMWRMCLWSSAAQKQMLNSVRVEVNAEMGERFLAGIIREMHEALMDWEEESVSA